MDAWGSEVPGGEVHVGKQDALGKRAGCLREQDAWGSGMDT